MSGLDWISLTTLTSRSPDGDKNKQHDFQSCFRPNSIGKIVQNGKNITNPSGSSHGEQLVHSKTTHANEKYDSYICVMCITLNDNMLISMLMSRMTMKNMILTVSFLAIRSAIVRFCDFRTSLTIGTWNNDKIMKWIAGWMWSLWCKYWWSFLWELKKKG